MKKAYFIADLHLGAGYQDSRIVEKSAVAFLDSIKDSAAEIYLLGDILDYWFEYKKVVPRGFVRFFGKLAELSDKGIKITWLIGNHDIWIFDYLPNELGIRVKDGVLEENVLGTPFLMQHGDAIGGNRKFRFLRSLFRNSFCQLIYSGIHPRWTVAFAGGWSKRSRLKRGVIGEWPQNLKIKLKEYCEQKILNGDRAKYFVFGHLHSREEINLSQGRKMIVVPAWYYDYEYAVFDGKELRFEAFNPSST